jgi:hypothetical protein
MKLLVSLASVLCAVSFVMADDENVKKGPAASELLSAGLTKAKEANKQVFLIFGSPGCGWCVKFQQYHDDPGVARVINKHLVIVKVDIVKNPGGEDLYKKYGSGDRGVPAFTVLDIDRNVLGDSGDGKDNIGFPYEPKEVEHYFKVLRKSCPKLSDEDVALLQGKLKGFRQKEEK